MLEEHRLVCGAPDDTTVIYRMMPEGSRFRFTKAAWQTALPFIIFADFECLTKTIHNQKNHTLYYQEHIPSEAALVVSAPGHRLDGHFEHFVGPTCAAQFIQAVGTLAGRLIRELLKHEPVAMTAADRAAFNSAASCHVCGHRFTTDAQDKYEHKVIDHDHVTGRFKGAAHTRCNLLLRQMYRVPVVFHNLKKYDGHIVTMAAAKYDEALSVIGESLESYKCISMGKDVVFIDSLAFLGVSLAALVEGLKRSGEAKFTLTKRLFPEDASRALLLRKGVFPYDYVNTWDCLTEQQLPPIDEFYNRLTDKKCSPADYEHAKQVWAAFNCQSLQDYQSLYIKSDVVLLADCFTEHRYHSHTHDL